MISDACARVTTYLLGIMAAGCRYSKHDYLDMFVDFKLSEFVRWNYAV